MTVEAVPAALRTRLGVATFATVTGGDFVWTRLDDGVLEPGGSITVRSLVPTDGDLDITIAPSAELARHSYLVRRHLAAAERRQDQRGAVTLSALPTEVAFVLPVSPPGETCRGPWRLVRLDDPNWIPQQLDSTGVFLNSERTTTLLLGPGRYQLQDPLEPARHQEFAVPADSTIMLSDELARPASGRH